MVCSRALTTPIICDECFQVHCERCGFLACQCAPFVLDNVLSCAACGNHRATGRYKGFNICNTCYEQMTE